MATIIVKERDGVTFRARWVGADGLPYIPSSVRWNLGCITNDTSVQSWLTITPGTENVIDIPGTLNAIILPANESEAKRLTVQANAGLAGQRTLVAEYVVQNNEFVS